MSALEVPVCDYENIPSSCVGEYDLSKEYFEYQQVIDSSYVDENAYCGQYENDEDLAYE